MLLTESGTVYGFGSGSKYQVTPESSEEKIDAPQRLYMKDSIRIAAIFADNDTSYALTRGGDILVWGDKSKSQFGTTDYAGNGFIYSETPTTEKMVTMSASTDTIMTLSENNQVYGWGNNDYNQLGMYDAQNATYSTVVNTPTLSTSYNFSPLADGSVWIPSSISAGQNSYVVYQNGKARALGRNSDYGQLGVHDESFNATDGSYSTLYTSDVDGDGILDADGVFLMLHAGDSDPENDDPSADPPVHTEFKNAKAIATAANGMNGIVYDKYGRMYAWGDNSRGQIGDGTQMSRNYPAAVLLDGGGSYIDFSEATVTRNGIDYDLKMYYDTYVRSDLGSGDIGMLETAVRTEDKIQIKLSDVFGVNGFTLFGESTYVPENLEFQVINTANTTIAGFTNSTSGTLNVGTEAGTTYLIAKDSLNNTGVIKLNVIPKETDSTLAANLSTMPMIAIGDDHTISLKSDGTVWAWGNNSYSQLGTGSQEIYTLLPEQVMKADSSGHPEPLTDIIKIAASGVHNLALDKDGHVWAWGSGFKGALGNGSKTNQNTRTYAQLINLYNDDDEMYLFGNDKDNNTTFTSRIIDIGASGTGHVYREDSDKQYSYALDADGNVYGWGLNYNGVIMPQTTNGAVVTRPVNVSSRNIIIKGARKLAPDKIGETMHVLKADGQIISWGDNSDGAYGIGSDPATTPSRTVLPTKAKAVAAYGGVNNAMAILMEGKVVMWGDLRQGQLGNGIDASNQIYDIPVDATNYEWANAGAFPIGGDISEYVQVMYDNYGLDANGVDGNLISAGINGPALGRGDFGGIPNGSSIEVASKVVAGKSDVTGNIKKVILVANAISSDKLSVITTNNGAVWAYGDNENGLIGDGTKIQRDKDKPSRVGTSYFLLEEFTKSLQVGEVQDLVHPRIASFNLFSGAEGTPTDDRELVWQTWDNQNNIADIIPGSSTLDKKIKGTGIGTTYVIVSLADDSMTVGAYKVEVRPNDSTYGTTMIDPGDTSYAYPQVVTGTNTTYALKPNGTVWVWGGNEYGQFGNGNVYGTELFPTQIDQSKFGNQPIIKIAAAGDSVFAIDANHHVWAWGRNDKGQLGLGETMEKVVTPSLVHRGDQNVDSTIADPDNDPMAPYMHDIVDVTVGGIDNDSLFALFLQKDGVVYGSGDNNYNQLGYTKTPGTKTVPTSYNEPVKLTNTVQQFAIGKSATAHMLRLDGKVYSMGKGTSFEYGTGNNTDNPLLRAGTADMDNRAMAVGAGAENVMALTYNLDQNNNIDSTVTGSIYVWGANRNGELDASGTDITLPTRLPIINRITLFGGGDAIYAVNNGTPIMAGVGTDGQLGLGTLSAASYTITDLSNEARTATGATFNNVISMSSSVGGSHTAFVDVDGYVWAYGNNSKGQIANQTVTENKMYAEQVGSDLIVTLDKSEILVKPGQDGQINYQARSGFNLYRDITDTTVDSAIYTSLDTGTATVGASTGLVSYANTGKTYVKFTAQKAGSADKTLFVHVIALPDDSAKPADEKYIAYPQVAAGDNFILALRANGDLYAWGDNTYGQLGLGLGRVGSVDYKPQRVIVTIPQYDINGDYIGESDPVKFTKIAAGADFSMAIDSDGNLYTWGRNDRGQIGDGTDTSKDISSSAYATVGNKEKLVPSPQKVTSFTDYGVKMQEVSAGGSAGHSYAMALTNTGDVFAWGHNSTHQVDNSSNAIVSTPSYVPVTRMTSIAAGNGIVDSTTGDDVATSYAVQEMGRVLVWGNNAYGEAGLGNTTGLAGKQWIVDDIQIPERALEVKAGAGNAFVMTENTSGTDYKYYGWGVNDHAQLSHNSPMTSAGSTSPVELSSSISAFANAASISTGDATILVQKDGNVYVSGRNTSGKLATANNVDYKVENIEQAAISNVLDAAVSANGNVSAFITKDGYIMTAGNNERGQLGNAVVNSDDYYTTTPVQVFTDSIDVDGLDDNIATLGKAGDTKDLTVTYNEFNAFNKTLNANFMYRSTNPAIADVTDNGNGNITVSYKSIGSARIVVYGQITKADGQTYDKYALFDVNVLPSNAEPSESVQPMVVTGNEFTVALTSDGHVYSWGDNSRGQGSFNTNKKTIITPTAVQRSGAMLSDIVSVAVGDNFTLAATRDGEVWSWGRNDKGVGQLGRKLTSNTSLYTPNKVNDVAATPSADPTTGLTLGGVNTGKVVKVFASGLTAAALTDQGTVYVWGDNSYGQLGIGHDMLTKYGSSSSSNIPIRMYGIDNAIDVMITERNIMIVNRDGTVYVTGNNEYGVLGNGEIWTGIHENSGKNLTIALPVMDKLDDGSTAILEGAANAAIGKEHAILNLYQYKADSDGAGTPAIVNELYAYGRNDYGVLGNGTAYREGENKFYSDNYDDNGVQLEADKNASGDWVDANGNEAERIVLFPNDKEKARINKWTKVTTYEDGVKIVTDVKEPLENIHSVFAGDHFSGAVAAGVLSTLGTGAVEKNYVYMWGDNIYDGYETGVLGNKSATNKQYRPRLVFKDDKTNDYLETIIQVPARLGGSHVAAISSKGVVYEWGKNTKYQLGDGTQINSVTPVVVGSANMIIRPASITISKDNSDTFRLMGMNMFAVYKELQDEVGAFDWRILDDSVAKLTFDERIPTNAIVSGATEGETRAVVTHRITGQTVFGRIIVTDDVTYAQMQLGKDFTVALKKDGTVWVWGDNENGAIGTGSSQKKLTIPVRIDEYYKSISDKNNGVISRFDDDKEKILKIAVGEDHVVAVGRSGKVYTWGSNAFGKLGLDAAVSTVDRPLLLDFDTPTTPVIVDIAAGTNHTLAATATGEVYSWGRNNKGQLGRKTVTSDYDTSNYKPQLMQGVGEGSLTGVIMVAATAEASGVLLANGTVWTVGGNSRGELGTGILPKDAAYNTQLERVIDIGEMDDTATPPVNIDMSGVTRLVGKGYNFGVILTQKKYLTNADGTPKMVNQSQAYSYLKNRQVYIWGDNTHGQLGTDNTPRVYGNSDGNGKYVTVPVRVVINHTDTTHWKAEDTSGSAWDPEYGDDPMSGKDSDTSEANILRNIANLSIGYDSETNETHVLAIDRAHHAYAWGSNTYNELGTNTNGDYETATAIRALYEKYDANGDPVITYDTNGDEVWNDLEIIGVSAGSTHSAAFLEDGLVYTWGHNQEGQLGNYTINEHSEYAQRLPGYVDEEYIALGEYNIVLNEVDDETDGIMIPAAFMRSFSLGDQIDKDKSMTLTATVMNEDIAVASMDLTQPNTTKYNIPYINIKPQAFGDTKLIVRYTDNDDHHNDKIAVANISVLRQKFADGTPDTTGNYKVSPMMESGDGFTVALRANGEVYTWGKNNKGQLANGSQPTERNIMLKKVEFAGLADGEYITRIAAGREHVIALASDGSVWAWGNNNQGQLGRLKSDIDFSTIPVQVGLINNIDTLNGLNIVDVFAGEYASYLITDGKTDIKIGDASNGQPVKIPLDTQRNTYVTGNANKTYNTSSKAYEYTGTGFGDKPQKLSIVQRVSKIAGSEVLKTGGTVWKLPMTSDAVVFEKRTDIDTADPDKPYILNDIVDISSKSPAGMHTLALNSKGNVLAWGAGTDGQLATSATEVLGNSDPAFVLKQTGTNPDTFDRLDGIIDIGAGENHSVALRLEEIEDPANPGTTINKGVVYTWGLNNHGQLGTDKSTAQANYPIPVAYITSDPSIIHVDGGYEMTSTMASDGYMWTFGKDKDGQLGNVDVSDSAEPVLVGKGELTVTPTEISIMKGSTQPAGLTIAASSSFNLFDDAVSGGAGTVTYTSLDPNIFTVDGTPTPDTITGVNVGKALLKVYNGLTAYVTVTVKNTTGDNYTPMVAAGQQHTVVLKANGEVYTWGDNTSGQLGRSDTDEIGQVVFPGGDLLNFVAASATASYAISDTDGRVYAWGNNDYKQLGSQTKTSLNDILVIQKPGGGNLTDIKEISTEGDSVLLLDKNGKVYTLGQRFGLNSYNIAEIKQTLPGVMQISGMYARTQAGTVWHVESDGSVQKVVIKDENGSDVSIIKIAAGVSHLLALDEDGNVWVVGSNADKQLGELDTDKSYTQGHKIEDLTDVYDIAAGANTSYALKKDATDGTTQLYSWGLNDHGQLGYTNSTSPIVRSQSAPQNILGISAGFDNVFTVDTDGRVWGSGLNSDRQLANGESEDSYKFVICGDSQIIIEKLRSDNSVESTGYGTIYFVQGEATKRLRAKYKGFNVFTQTDADYSDYDFTFEASDPTLLTLTPHLDALSNPIKGYADADASSYTGTLYVRVYENTMLNKTSFAKVVVLPDTTQNNVTEHSDKFLPKAVAGGNHVTTLRYDGSIHSYGVNEHGQLGTGDTVSIDVPTAANVPATAHFVSVDAGEDHSIALDTNGKIWVTGNNDRGQLGQDMTTVTELHDYTQFTTEIPEKVVQVIAGDGVSFAITEDGEVYAWGDNSRGQLGLDTIGTIDEPTKLRLKDVREVSSLTDHTLFLQMNGTIFAAGANDNKGLGISGASADVSTPTKISGSVPNTVGVSAGGDFSLLLSYGGTVSSFGENRAGQLGNQSTKASSSIETVIISGSAGSQPIVEISAGQDHALAVGRDNELYVWGNNKYGQLGLGGTSDSSIILRDSAVNNPTYLSDVYMMGVSAGKSHSVIANKEGVVYGFGDYLQGADETTYGLASVETRSDTPVMIGGNRLFAGDNEVTIHSSDTDVELKVITGDEFNLLTDYVSSNYEVTVKSINEDIATAYIDASGKVRVNGGMTTGLTHVIVTSRNKTYNNITTTVYFVTNIDDDTSEKSSIVAPMTASGREHTVVLKQDGTVWTFGNNRYGQLGNSMTYEHLTNEDKNIPQQVEFNDLDSDEYIVSVYAGEYHSAALTSKGNVYTWGSNERGQLGINVDPSIINVQSTPIRVTGLGKIVKMGLGNNHSFALTDSGIVYTWGDNERGQLGVGISKDVLPYSPKPMVVKSVNKVVDISHGSGNNTVFAIKYDGTLWGWGQNDAFQIENVDVAIYTEPKLIELVSQDGLTNYTNNVVRLYTGQYHSAALVVKADYNTVSGNYSYTSDIITWGQNTYGQLGRTTTTDLDEIYPDVVDKSNLSGGSDYIVDVATGAVHNILMLADQRVATWGDGSQGRLGLEESLLGLSGTGKNVDLPTIVKVDDLKFDATGAVSYDTNGDPEYTEEDLKALTISVGGAFSLVGRSVKNNADPAADTYMTDYELSRNGLLYGFGAIDRGQLATASYASNVADGVYKPIIILGGEAGIKPKHSVLYVGGERQMKVSLPKFYLTEAENASSDKYTTSIFDNDSDDTRDVITFNSSTNRVLGENTGEAVLNVFDLDYNDSAILVKLQATFEVKDPEGKNIEDLFYDNKNAENNIFNGEAADGNWFLNSGYFDSGEYSWTTVPTGATTSTQVLTLVDPLTQIYSVFIEQNETDGLGNLTIHPNKVTNTTIRLRHAETGLIYDVASGNAEMGTDTDGKPTFTAKNIPVNEVELYYFDFTTTNPSDGSVTTTSTKVAVIAKPTKLEVKELTVFPLYNDADLVSPTQQPHAAAMGVSYKPVAVMLPDGSDVDYYYYIASDKDISGNSLVGATIYMSGNKYASVSIKGSTPNADHDGYYHPSYIDEIKVPVDGNGNKTIIPLTITPLDGSAGKTYPLHIITYSYAMGIDNITVTDKKNAANTYTAIKTDENTYQVVIPATIDLVDISTLASFSQAYVGYLASGDAKYGINNAQTFTINDRPAVFKDVILGPGEEVPVFQQKINISDNKLYTLNIIRISEENNPYVAVNYVHIEPTGDGNLYEAAVGETDTTAKLLVSTILAGGSVKIGDNPATLSISDVVHTLNTDPDTGYEDVPFIIYPPSSSSALPQQKTIRLYRESADPRLKKITVDVYASTDTARAAAPIESVEAYYDTKYQRYVAFIDDYDPSTPMPVTVNAWTTNDTAWADIDRTATTRRRIRRQ